MLLVSFQRITEHAMAFQSAPDVASAEILYTLQNGVIAENVLYFRNSGYDQAAVDDLAEAVDGWMATYGLDILSIAYLYNFVHVKGLQDIVDVEAINNTNAGAGTGAAGFLPNETSLALSFRTGFTGRSARGRVYLMPPGEADMSDLNHITTTYRNAVQTAYENLGVQAAVAGWQHVVLSRISGGAPRVTATNLAVTDYIVTDLTLDSQRGRKPTS
jgi:hypothetical protein